MSYFSLKFENDKLIFINQRLLPDKEEYVETEKYERIAEAIEKLEIRGAPAIGIAAMYALALAIKSNSNNFFTAYERLKRTRPTAVNLFNALETIRKFYEADLLNRNYDSLVKFAKKFHKEDENYCNKIGVNGADYLSTIFNCKINILTHCNTGKFATGGNGTAFSIILELHRRNLINHVYACETRPLLQGLRLTSFELMKNEIPYSIIVDSSAAYLMSKNYIDVVIIGADRIARNGDVANKIGTYSHAINAKHHNIPFIVAAPSTTIDLKLENGDSIPIEVRDSTELLYFGSERIIQNEINTLNFAFDITPCNLINAIITEQGVFTQPFNFVNDKDN